MVEEKGQLPCPLSFMQDGMIPRLLSLWFHFDDCPQGMVSEPPRDPFSDAKLATQKLFEMDWKCQDGLSLFILLIMFVILLKRWDLMGSLDTKAQGCSSALERPFKATALNLKQFACAESFQSKKRGG